MNETTITHYKFSTIESTPERLPTGNYLPKGLLRFKENNSNEVLKPIAGCITYGNLAEAHTAFITICKRLIDANRWR